MPASAACKPAVHTEEAWGGVRALREGEGGGREADETGREMGKRG